MKVSTFTVVVGTSACNGCCPFCVSRMTPNCSVGLEKTEVNRRNFYICARFAKEVGATTALLTGKGEPTLYPEAVREFTYGLKKTGFHIIELQTNGLIFRNEAGLYEAEEWFTEGMTTISISIVHYDVITNARIMYKGVSLSQVNFWKTINDLHKIGFTIRLNVTALKGGIDNIDHFRQLIECARNSEVEQLTIRNVARPWDTQNTEVAKYVDDHHIPGWEKQLQGYLEMKGAVKLLELQHGAVVYDYHGQNVCINNCLTSSTDPEEIRQLIFFPDGRLRYDWKYKGAVIL